MLSWLFKKKRGDVAAPKVVSAAQPPAPAVPPQADTKAADDAKAEWHARLQSAQGDDAALLRVALEASALETRLAAVDALVSEEVLKQAERELRGHDRRVHRAAKRRWEAAVAQREARARAQALIETAASLAGLDLVPANRLVALDRDWQAIDAQWLAPAQLSEFSALREQLNAAMRERGEQQQHLQRWSAEAKRALAQLQLACAEAQADSKSDADADAGRITSSREAVQALRDARPDVPASAALDQALQAALEAAAEVEAHVAARAAQRRAAELAPAPAPVIEPAAPAAKGPTAEQRLALDSALQQAEAAVAEGRLGAMPQHLQAIAAALDAMHGVAPHDPLWARHQALHAEWARLKGWQQWGGARARDELVAEAEGLARLTLAAADPDVPNPPKLHLKSHADAIRALRKRWKELDRLGAAASQALWQRFDAALQTAYQPVAAQQAALDASRRDNLAAREALLATLDALPELAASTSPDDIAAHSKEQLRALERFHAAWRQLGPIEHTVPPDARSGLLQRLRSSLERVETPLQAARGAAEAVREQLIVRAEALVQELRLHPELRDANLRLRELQAEWQQHARALPLARAVENALWARFKAASDAVHAQREAAFDARDAELAANLAAREALLERLSALGSDTPAAEIQRTLAEADRAWRQAVEVPRGAAGAIDARFRDARAAALQHLHDSGQKRWQAECDALLAKLALCEERGIASTTYDAGDPARRWAGQPALRAAWEHALAERWSQPEDPGPLPPAAMDELLLKLEAALDLPSPSEWQAARRDLKLRAMKDTLEGRASALPDPARRIEWLAAALRQAGSSAAQRERLHALIAELRHAPPL